MDDLLNAALRYARRGWRVFPLRGKEPLISNNLERATTKPSRVRKWWKKWPDANIGIACDSKSGPIVIDIDAPKKGEADGFKFLRQNMNGELTTRTAISRKGRLHLYLAPMRNGTRIRRMIRPIKDDKGRKVAIDILGDGGYVVAPPSIHPDTEKKYRWGQKLDLLPFPKQFFKFLKKRDIHNVAPPLPEVIHHGERDALLTSLAGSMRRRGASPKAILEALRVENTARVRPPLDDSQLRKIARSIGRKAPVPDDEHLTDLGNARRFVAHHHSKVRSILTQNRNPYLVWRERRWELDTTGEVERLAKASVRDIYRDAVTCPDDDRRDELIKHALKSEGIGKIKAMIDLASTEPEISMTPESLDADPWLFNVQNGTINLKTGQVQPHRRGDYITKISSAVYDENAKCPRWEQSLREWLAGDETLIEFFRRAVGYSMTGDVSEHCLFFCYGKGRNGKTTALEVIRQLMGDYATQSDFTSFQSMRGDGPRSDIARMQGARFVSAVEAREDRGFDTTVIKQMTGGDTVVARRLYEDFTEYRPQFKLWLAANHKPMVKEQTHAFWERIRLIPFTVIIPRRKRKKNLGRKLMVELPGILNWALQGCRDWQSGGLQPPKTVTKATRSYKSEHDVLSEFFATSCQLDATGWTPSAALYQAFSDWWTETRGHRSTPISMVGFGRMISERSDIASKTRDNVRGYKGVLLKDIET